jgi:membrane protein DedA with SNARE-associated domain
MLGLAPTGFLAAIWLGSLAWNTPLLTLGFVLRGSGADPASSGLLVVAGLVALELAVFAALWVGHRARLRPVAKNDR